MITPQIKTKILNENNNRPLTKSKERISKLGEVFTPAELIIEMLEQLPIDVWEDGKTFLEPTVGSGNFLAAILITKIELGHKNTLNTIYGVDIMQDNVDECKERLLNIAGNTPENREIVNKNIRCEDGLKYDYSFSEEQAPIDKLFEW